MMRNALKAVRTAETRDDLVEKVRVATRVIDRLAVKGIVHKNFAANRKSQMARMIANFAAK
jgi:ribosomal protein S20